MIYMGFIFYIRELFSFRLKTDSVFSETPGNVEKIHYQFGTINFETST